MKVIDFVARAEISPEIAGFFPLEEAAAAHRLMEERKAAGRVVLVHGQSD
jgi:NADPH:quinone reductase-like Zn-dependent oxidoreductase